MEESEFRGSNCTCNDPEVAFGYITPQANLERVLFWNELILGPTDF